ncbi:ABC transporter ATP-binding protein [Fusobacterium sp. THCT1E2]
MERTPLLEVKNLKQYFKINKKFTVKAVDDISFNIYPGETYGLVGESGSGKSTTGRSIIRLYEPTDGEVNFKGVKISGKLSTSQLQHLRTKMQMIFQDPMACLNPRMKVIDIIAQGLDIHKLYKDEKEREEKVYHILELVGLSHEHAMRYPHQFSGGQRQRIGIARALIMNPELIIADEAISALDVSIQAQVVNLMKELQKKTGAAYLFIAHDLSMVKYISDRIGVLHLGHLVETGTTEEIFNNPIHPYTKSLLSAIPLPDPRVEKVRIAMTYDYKSSGIDYTKGKQNHIDGQHYVLATDEELNEWIKK